MDGFTYWFEIESKGHYYFYAFPFVILLLLVVLKGRKLRFIIPSVLITLVIVNPFFYKVWDNIGMYAYWRLLWTVPVIPVLACLAPGLTERIGNSWIKGAVAAVCAALVALGGTILYDGTEKAFTPAVNAEKLPEKIIEIADRLLELDDHPKIIAQYPVGVYIRQYSGEIRTLYGRDVEAFIAPIDDKAMAVHKAVSNGQMESVAQFMNEEGYDYLIYSDDAGESFDLVDNAGGYGIYRVKNTDGNSP